MKERDYNPPYDSCGSDVTTYLDGYSRCYIDGKPAGYTRTCDSLPGTVLYDNKCYTTVEKNISYSCPNGYTKNNNQCYLTEKKDATKVCPKDFSLEKDKCVSEVDFTTE